ncbi:hydroxypyruvate isomerase [Streptomyces libani subsp. rufus]|nr:hydroxypyruvate isomerase [Streptomyces libani subsp. rufus]
MSGDDLRYVVNCSLLFPELPLLQRPAAAKRAGFDEVEFQWPFERSVPSDRDVDAFVAALRDAGVALTGLNFSGGDPAAGERGLMSLPDRVGEVADNIDVVVGIGERTGCRVFNALYGTRTDGVPAQAQDEVAAFNLTRAAKSVHDIGGTVVVEPISGVPAYPLRLAADVLAVLDRVSDEGKVTNLAMLADLYHLAVNGEDIPPVIEYHTDRIGHVQIADASGRGHPGSGKSPLREWLTALARRGYRGRVGLEYHPSSRPTDLSWLETF